MAFVPAPVRRFRSGKDFDIGENLGDQPRAEGYRCVERMSEEDDLNRAKVCFTTLADLVHAYSWI